MPPPVRMMLSGAASETLDTLMKSCGQELAFVIGGGCCEGTTISLFEKTFSVGYAPVSSEGPLELFVERGWKHLYEGKTIFVDVTDDDGSDRMSLEARLGKRFMFRLEEEDTHQGVCLKGPRLDSVI